MHFKELKINSMYVNELTKLTMVPNLCTYVNETGCVEEVSKLR